MSTISAVPFSILGLLLLTTVSVSEIPQCRSRLNGYFVSVMTQETTPHPNCHIETPTARKSFINFSIQDIANLMMKIQPHKAAGPDDIHPRVLKEVLTLAQPLHILFKQSLATGEIPSDWRRENICALFKKGKRTDPANYRPVSLTSQVSKLLERLVLRELLAFCNNYQILSCSQHGFRSGCSCMTNLMECFNDWTNSFDHIGTSIDIVVY